MEKNMSEKMNVERRKPREQEIIHNDWGLYR